MQTDDINTYFAPPERLSADSALALRNVINEDPVVRVILDSVSGLVLILNRERQILAANPTLLEALKMENDGCIVGLRPGEMLNCVHYRKGPAGCGTSPYCHHCGAVLTILAAQNKGEPATGECRLSMEADGNRRSMEFAVRATPLEIGGISLIIFVLHDISSNKRREVLEQMLFHDLNNILFAIMNLADRVDKTDNPKNVAQKIINLSFRLNRQIESHRIINMAEDHSLAIREKVFSVNAFLDTCTEDYLDMGSANGITIETRQLTGDVMLKTDEIILMRIMGNMLKNALEATGPGGTIQAWFDRIDGRPAFHVHNSGKIPDETADRIFERSFSTKGSPGHGIGTYSIKLLGENYLGGSVSFTTDETNGTIFTFVLPEKSLADN